MSIWKLFAITTVLCAGMAFAHQIDSFEKQALSLAQTMPASDLDSKLPNLPFAGWLEQTVGAKAGVTWQLTECGRQLIATSGAENDLTACAEFNAVLPDKRRVFITISVGTFKKGLTGKPAFFSAVIEQDAELHQVRQLYELAEALRATERVSDNLLNKRPATKTKNQIVRLPAINVGSKLIVRPSSYLPSLTTNFPGPLSQLETPPHQPLSEELEKVSESVLQGRAIIKVNPVYPPSARKLNATGTVQVEVTISELGVVIEAIAISGHLALRSAAVDAARKWVFKPAILSGVPVKIKGVLSFNFGPGAR